jgi:hypothetical protein
VEAVIQGIAVQRREGEQTGQVGGVPEAIAVGLAETDVATPGETPEERVVTHLEACLRTGTWTGEAQSLAAGELQVEAAVGDPLEP